MLTEEKDGEPLLPTTNVKKGRSEVSNTFKAYVICVMTVLWTAYTLTVKYTRSSVATHMLYSSTTVVFTAEAVKMFISLTMLFAESKYDLNIFTAVLSKYYWNAPRELALMAVPSIAYALQNNLDFVALTHLDAGLYQVTTQLKVVTTAVFMMIFLRRRFSGTRWCAIIMLFAGVACVQLNNESFSASAKEVSSSYIVGLSAVLATCFTAGFAGVYFEMMLKNGGDTPFWIRNLQMYSCGVVSAAMACMSDYNSISRRGFFFGYDVKVCLIVGFLSLGGVYISLVMKHLDNLHKSFASAVSIILVVILSFVIFQNVFIGAYFVLGTSIVVGAVLLYNSVPE